MEPCDACKPGGESNTIEATGSSSLTIPREESSSEPSHLQQIDSHGEVIKLQQHSTENSVVSSAAVIPITASPENGYTTDEYSCSRPQTQPNESTRTPPTTESSRYDSLDASSINERTLKQIEEGGPLWRAARGEAESNMRQGVDHRRVPRLPESIMAQARSRADVDNFDHGVAISSSGRVSGHMRQLNAVDDAFIINSTLAKKRVRVVQLLVFGLFGFLLGLLGSCYTQSTCQYASARVEIDNGNTILLHFGFWKWSTIQSVFEESTLCSPYYEGVSVNNFNFASAPHLSRIFGISSIFAGSYALSVLWLYLICGKGTYKYWIVSVIMAFLAGTCQALTLLFFQDTTCQKYICYFGPGSYMSIISSMAWFILSFELYYNMPMSRTMIYANPGSSGSSMVTALEMADFSNGASAYFDRVSQKESHRMPTLKEIQRLTKSEGSTIPLNHNGSYRPPTSAVPP